MTVFYDLSICKLYRIAFKTIAAHNETKEFSFYKSTKIITFIKKT